MDIISELNQRPFMTYFKRDAEWDGTIPVIMVPDHFQYSLKVLEIESVVVREIAAAYPSGAQAMIATRVLARKDTGKTEVPEDRMLDWQEKET